MRIVLISDSRSCITAFDSLKRSRNYTLEVRPSRELKAALEEAGRDAFVYMDVTGLSLSSVRSRLRQAQAAVGRRFGLVDRNGTVPDVAEVFQRGAADFVGARLLKEGLTSSRFSRVVDFALDGEEPPDSAPATRPTILKPSGSTWEDVEPGQEYTFQVVYVGLDHMKEMRRKSSEDLLRSLRRTLQSILTRSFAAIGGKIWVWKEDDGVLLCPFDGTRATALIPAMRLVLNRVLINIEQFSVTTPISWRMGLHIGNIPYAATGETSQIVCEDLNFIFHLGERAVKPGRLAVTQNVLALASDRVAGCFERGPEFESTPLHFMRNPV